MSFFKWDSNIYSLEISQMDEEHQKLIEIMNNLHHKNELRRGKSELSKIIQELYDYVVFHFQSEETYLLSIQYPNLEAHKKIHVKLLLELKHFQLEYDLQNSSTLNARFFEFLEMWLSSHIQHFDKDYSLFLKSLPNPHQT